uniref:Actin n=1 Tax=Rhizophora mucronata TaxID=61149 RepID=A0A2P2MF65_RHIMU
MPDLFHVIPVTYNSMLNGVFQSQNTSLGLSLISNICIFLAHSNHHTSMTRSTNNAGENSSWSIISSKSSLRAIKDITSPNTIHKYYKLKHFTIIHPIGYHHQKI